MKPSKSPTETPIQRRITLRDGGRSSSSTSTLGRILDGLQELLGVVMLLSGGSKLAGSDQHIQSFEQWGYPQWFRVVTGGLEVSGGVGLLAGRSRPMISIIGESLTLTTMLGALYTHFIQNRDPPTEAVPAMVLLLLTALVTKRQLTENTADGHDTGESHARSHRE